MTRLLNRISSEYGWREEPGGFSPVMTTMDTTPDVILQLCNVAIHKKQSAQY